MGCRHLGLIRDGRLGRLPFCTDNADRPRCSLHLTPRTIGAANLNGLFLGLLGLDNHIGENINPGGLAAAEGVGTGPGTAAASSGMAATLDPTEMVGRFTLIVLGVASPPPAGVSDFGDNTDSRGIREVVRLPSSADIKTPLKAFPTGIEEDTS